MKIPPTCLLAITVNLFPLAVTAQITPDGSTSTTVNTNGNVSTIEAGEQAGSNLFHSFQDFSVPNGNEAFFNNSADIDNIFSRVTGGNISTIDGLIRANDTNLFLINPSGVIFGSGARLNIGGSFYGGTADSILFPEGVEFSANETNAPILTINAPIGLNFRDNPESITVQNSNLTVSTGENLSLVGGELDIDGGNLNALEGKVNLGALLAAGTVTFDENLDLDFSNLSLADISLSNDARVNVNGQGDGAIAVNARNLTLSDTSFLTAGINSESSTPETQAGDITINAFESVVLQSGSIIRNNLSPNSSGNAGEILITAQNLTIDDESRLSTVSEGNGNTGNINLDIGENITLNRLGEIKSQILEGATGNSGNINVSTSTLNLTAGSSIFTNISGEGSAGNINIAASDRIILDSSNFQTKVTSEGVGIAGDIDINAASLLLKTENQSDSSLILASTAGEGNAGNINIEVIQDITLEGNSSIQTQVESEAVGNSGDITVSTTDLILKEGSDTNRPSLLANSEGDGNGGNININATGNVSLDQFGLILSQGTAKTGDAGDVSINSDTLSLTTKSLIISNTGNVQDPTINNIGDAGNIDINSRIISLDNFSEITNNSLSNAEGQAGNVSVNTTDLTIAGGSNINALTENNSDGGNIEINASNIELVTGGKIVTGTNSEGNAGNITLDVTEQITIDGENAPIPTEELRLREVTLQNLEPNTGLFANTTNVSSGDGGSIQIANPETFSIFNGGEIAVDSQGTGNGGNLSIQAQFLTLENQSRLIAETAFGQAAQQPSNINLDIEDTVSLQGDSLISARASNNANGGNITIDTNFLIAFSAETNGNDIIANASEGSGGRIDLTAEAIFGLEERNAEPGNKTNDLDVTSDLGVDGNLSINTPDVSATGAVRDLPVNAIVPEENVQQVCAFKNADSISSLELTGKGGIPIEPTAAMSSDNLLFSEQFSQTDQTSLSQNTYDELSTQVQKHAPIVTAQGKIQPARGIIVTAAGELLLTASAQERSPKPLNTTFSCLANS